MGEEVEVGGLGLDRPDPLRVALGVLGARIQDAIVAPGAETDGWAAAVQSAVSAAANLQGVALRERRPRLPPTDARESEPADRAPLAE